MSFIAQGGMWFTVPILIIGLVNLIMFFYLISKKVQKLDFHKKWMDFIMFLGGFALIFGISGQLIGFYQAAGAIQQGGEISPSLIWGGVRVSLIAPIMGFVVLLISSILWFILKPRK